MRLSIALSTIIAAAGIPLVSAANEGTPVTSPLAEERVEVTATKYPDDPDTLPQSITVISGDDLRDRGATDLRTALAMVAGVDIAPGGDGGPASAIPEMWGLREQDAYLLLVDGVPWGGTFNPQVTTLSLQDVERIEIMRGAAPVMYGIASFVGVIQVIHYAPGHGPKPGLQAAVGSYGSAAIASSFDLPTWEGFASRLTVDAEQREFKDPRTDFTRGHLLWRNQAKVSGDGEVHFGIDGNFVDQSPESPVNLVGTTLSENEPLDTNYNPSDAQVNPWRVAASGGFTLPKSYGIWSGVASYAHSETDSIRGFVTDASAGPVFPATGDRSSLTLDEFYLDGHLEFTNVTKVQILVGADYQYGKGHLTGGEINYLINSDGSNPPFGASIPADTDAKITDTRNWGGLYGYAAWTPNWRWRVDGGLRLNITDESRDTSLADFPAATFDQGSDSASKTKPGGSVGATFTAWHDQGDNVRLFADYRNTFKPAAAEFDLEADAEILKPEEGQSIELGARTTLFEQKLEIEMSIFNMELKDVVLPAEGGAPGALENEAEEEFKGAEVEARARLGHDILLRGAASYHSAKFKESEEEGGTGGQDLAGNRQEMTPEWLAGAGIVYAPPKGFIAHADVAFTGSRWLDRDNTAIAEQFTTWGMGIGWRGDRWTVRLDGTNLNDRRDPVAESELGPESFYRLSARRIWATFDWTF